MLYGGMHACFVVRQPLSFRLCPWIWLQALAYQWLGRWYEEIDQDYKQAQDCYERAVALDDDDIIASKSPCIQASRCKVWKQLPADALCPLMASGMVVCNNTLLKIMSGFWWVVEQHSMATLLCATYM